MRCGRTSTGTSADSECLLKSVEFMGAVKVLCQDWLARLMADFQRSEKSREKKYSSNARELRDLLSNIGSNTWREDAQGDSCGRKARAGAPVLYRRCRLAERGDRGVTLFFWSNRTPASCGCGQRDEPPKTTVQEGTWMPC